MADIDVENPPENMETEETPTAEEPTEENDDRAMSAKFRCSQILGHQWRLEGMPV